MSRLFLISYLCLDVRFGHRPPPPNPTQQRRELVVRARMPIARSASSAPPSRDGDRPGLMADASGSNPHAVQNNGGLRHRGARQGRPEYAILGPAHASESVDEDGQSPYPAASDAQHRTRSSVSWQRLLQQSSSEFTENLGGLLNAVQKLRRTGNLLSTLPYRRTLAFYRQLCDDELRVCREATLTTYER